MPISIVFKYVRTLKSRRQLDNNLHHTHHFAYTIAHRYNYNVVIKLPVPCAVRTPSSSMSVHRCESTPPPRPTTPRIIISPCAQHQPHRHSSSTSPPTGGGRHTARSAQRSAIGYRTPAPAPSVSPMDLLTPNAPHVFLTNGLSAITPGGVKKLASMVVAGNTADQMATAAKRPPFVPEKMHFSSYRKFEGEHQQNVRNEWKMLINKYDPVRTNVRELDAVESG